MYFFWPLRGYGLTGPVIFGVYGSMRIVQIELCIHELSILIRELAAKNGIFHANILGALIE